MSDQRPPGADWNEAYPNFRFPPKFPSVYPLVSKVIEPHSMAAGKFLGSRPHGVTVHYTADMNLSRVIASLRGRTLGYHLLIDRDGKVIQTSYLDSKVNHAGPSKWHDESCNKWHAAIAIMSWGEVKKEGGKIYSAWNGAKLEDKDVDGQDIVERPSNVKGVKAFWQAATKAQEETLLQMLRWFMTQGIDPRKICGHDEAAIPPGRKIDPGGVLSMTMPELRNRLCAEVGINPDLPPRPARLSIEPK